MNGNEYGEKFLALYREFEKALRQKIKADGYMPVFSMMMKLKKTEKILDDGDNFEFLKTMSELRNLLVHEPMLNNEYIAVPTKHVLKRFERIIGALINPLDWRDVAITGNIFTAAPSQKVSEVAQAMQARGFSHVPVVSDGLLRGVFSRGALFSCYLRGVEISGDTVIGDIMDIISISESEERFAVCDERTLLSDVVDLFNQREKNRRLAMIMITKGGRMTGHLLGIITPWDVIKHSDL